MAATRKLQGEIDRCLKKVTEGVELFEDIWQKVHNAANNNQKEKYETDLKKEIKKLQRLRDQIKSWIQSAEIKDKSVLLENRKLIETQMERFKVVERETKTKAYSKEGLGAAQKMDPAQKERDDITQWLNNGIESLNIQKDQFEAEIESLLAGKKKKLDKDKQERMDKLKDLLEKHRFHIRKMEILLRMLDNMSVEVEQIKKIKDDIEYYIDAAHSDPDFEENIYIYDDINFDEFTEVVVGPVAGDGSAHEAESSASSPGGASSPISSPALNHQAAGAGGGSSSSGGGTGTTTTPSSNAAPATPNDSADERRARTHRSSTDESHSKTPAQVAPVKPAPIKAPSAKILQTTPSKSSTVSHMTPNNSSPSSGSAMSNHVNPAPPSTQQVNGALAYAAVTEGGILTSLCNSSNGAESGAPATASAASTTSHASQHQQAAQLPSAPAAAGPAAALAPKLSSSASLDSTSTAPSPLPSAPTPPTSSSAAPSATAAPAAPAAASSSSAAPSSLSSSSSSASSTSSAAAPSAAFSSSAAAAAALAASASAHVPSVNGPLKGGAESLTLRAMAQQAVDQQGGTAAPGAANEVQASVLYDGSSGALTAGNSINSNSNNSSSSSSSNNNNSSSTVSAAAAATLANNLNNMNNNGAGVVGSGRGGSGVVAPSQTPLAPPSAPTGEAHIPPLLGVAPLGPMALSKEQQIQHQSLEAAFYHMPHPSDSERLRHYLPRSPYMTQVYYPQTVPMASDTLDFFHRLSTETLFFIFYYLEGTKAQYLAAKALKKQSWRFHTKFMMWFQRHEEPKTITEEYEMGTYIYFDYEKWAQRRKEGFTFEYRYLEDRDLN